MDIFRSTQGLPRHSLARPGTGGSDVLPSQGIKQTYEDSVNCSHPLSLKRMESDIAYTHSQMHHSCTQNISPHKHCLCREGKPEELLQADQPRADVMPRGGLDISDEVLDSEGAARVKTKSLASGFAPCSISFIPLLLFILVI